MIRALGLDAGATTGWAVLDIEARGVAHYIESGTWRPDLTPRVPYALAERARADGVTLVVVELPRGHLYRGHEFATKHLAAAAEVGGELAGAFRANNLQVVTCTAADWRKGICSSAHATDAAVKTAIRLRVRGWPARSSSHERDAAGAAIWAALDAMSARRTG